MPSADEEVRNNLLSYTDPNGQVTRYVWYQPTDSLPGETAFFFI